MCVDRNGTRGPQIYLQSTGNFSNCSCHVSGDVSSVDILQTAMVELMMYEDKSLIYGEMFSDSLFFMHLIGF
jgi:hypothetical protein